MVVSFAPQFFLLIGIDLFLAGSIAATLLEEYYPKPLAYIFDIASFIGFAQLWSGPEFLGSFNTTAQFYYCAGFALISVASIVAANLYLFIIKRKTFLATGFAALLTIPAFLIMLFFTSTYVNDIPIQLPLMPVFSWEQIYLLFAIAIIMLVLAVASNLYKINKKAKPIIKNEEATLPDSTSAIEP